MDAQVVRQLKEGRLFLHEHPANATSWDEPCVLEVLQHVGVRRITADQCQLGQQASNGEPIRKPTGFMSNCDDVLDQLHRRCKGRNGQCSRPQGGTHQLCQGKVARRAAIFQRELCEGVLIGLRDDEAEELRAFRALHAEQEQQREEQLAVAPAATPAVEGSAPNNQPLIEDGMHDSR